MNNEVYENYNRFTVNEWTVINHKNKKENDFSGYNNFIIKKNVDEDEAGWVGQE